MAANGKDRSTETTNNEGEVSLVHEGITYEIRIGINAMAVAEGNLGMNMGDIGANIGSFRVMRVLLWAGLEDVRERKRPHRRPYTIPEAGQLIENLGVRETAKFIGEAWNAAITPTMQDAVDEYLADDKEKDDSEELSEGKDSPSE